MKKLGLIVMWLWAAGLVGAQTNIITQVTNTSINVMATNAWNFVVEAKYLTDKEREQYNARANAAWEMQRLGVGYGGVNIVRLEVETLEALREIQNSRTNLYVHWLGSPSVQYFVQKGSNSWESAYGRAFNCIADPTIEIGLRADGQVVWRKKKEESVDGHGQRTVEQNR